MSVQVKSGVFSFFIHTCNENWFNSFVGTMNDLLVFFCGNVMRDEPCGLDLSQCQYKVVRIEGLEGIGLLELRRCIRREFDRETARNKIIIQAVTCRPMDDGSSEPFWDLYKVTGDGAWSGYMEVVSTPGSPLYGRPMVHVQFIERMQAITGGEVCSIGGDTEAAAIYGGAELVVARTEDNPMKVDEGQLVFNDNTNPYWSARVDCFEAIESMPNELDSVEDHDEKSDGSEDEGDHAFGGGPSRRAVADEMDEVTVQQLVISHDVNSRWGFDEDTLMVGQRFPSKDATKIAIAKYAVSISRQYKAKRSNPECLKVVCVDPNCPGRICAI